MLSVGVIGAGSIGTICGLSLARNTSHKVVLVGRTAFLQAVRTNQETVRLRDKSRNANGGQDDFLVEETFRAKLCAWSSPKNDDTLDKTTISNNNNSNKHTVSVTDDVRHLKTFDCSVIIVATKTTATEQVGLELAKVLPLDSNATIVSFQNGVRNAAILRNALKDHKHIHVSSSMVNFNAYWEVNTNLFQKTTDGGVAIELPSAMNENDNDDIHTTRIQALAQALTEQHVPSKTVDHIQSIQYSKLLINLFNAVNALAGKSTPATLEQKGYRKVWGAAITEGLTVLNKKGIPTATYRGMPPTLLPWMQALPDTLFWVVFRYMAKMDDSAKSSMLQDLERGRTTSEVDDLCGEIVRLGNECHDNDTTVPTPVNAALVRLVHDAEAAGKGSPCISAEELVKLVGLE